MRLKTIEKKIADFGFTKTQETLDFIRYEKPCESKNYTHIVTLERHDNCIYWITSYAISYMINNSSIQPMALLYNINDLFTMNYKYL